MYKIQFCDIKKAINTPRESDWIDLEYIYDNADDANIKRIELYKRGDGYYRVVLDDVISVMKIIEQTMADGPGLRTSLYCAGCYHDCPNCHNPQTHDIKNGNNISIDELAIKLINDPCKGITFSGGDPLYQAEQFIELAKRIKQNTDKTIWLYTGFKYEFIKESPKMKHILDYIDVVVDGPFIESLKSDRLAFRGSSNQRIIDVVSGMDISNQFDLK